MSSVGIRSPFSGSRERLHKRIQSRVGTGSQWKARSGRQLIGFTSLDRRLGILRALNARMIHCDFGHRVIIHQEGSCIHMNCECMDFVYSIQHHLDDATTIMAAYTDAYDALVNPAFYTPCIDEST